MLHVLSFSVIGPQFSQNFCDQPSVLVPEMLASKKHAFECHDPTLHCGVKGMGTYSERVVVSPNVLVSGWLVSGPSGPQHIASTTLLKLNTDFRNPNRAFR